MLIQIPYSASETIVKKATITSLPGQRYLREALVVIPNTANAVTFTFSVIDENGYTRRSDGSLARNSVNMIIADRIIKNGYSIGIQASGATGTDITVSIYLDFLTALLA